MSNLSPEALHLLHVHAAGGWELVAQHQREAAAAARTEAPKEPTVPGKERLAAEMTNAQAHHVACEALNEHRGPGDPFFGELPHAAQRALVCLARQSQAYAKPDTPAPSPPPNLRTAAEEVLRYMDKIGFGDGSAGRARVQKLLRDALGEGG